MERDPVVAPTLGKPLDLLKEAIAAGEPTVLAIWN